MRLKMKYEIVATDEIISNNTGLVLVNNIINLTNFKQNINDKTHIKVQSREISNKDIFKRYNGMSNFLKIILILYISDKA